MCLVVTVQGVSPVREGKDGGREVHGVSLESMQGREGGPMARGLGPSGVTRFTREAKHEENCPRCPAEGHR